MVISAALSTLLWAAASLGATPQTLALSGTARSLVPLSATPQALTATATRDLPLLPKRPPVPKLEQAVPWEYFTVVTLLSAPFTVLWSGLIAGAVEFVAQGGRSFPPKFSSSAYAIVGGVAASASVGIGLFSLSWGGQGAPRTLSATASPTPDLSPVPPGPRHA